MLTDSPLVSIIVPTYNRPDMLFECVQSIAGQTLKDIEAVVINDAGRDVSDVIKRFSNFVNIIYLSHDTHKGVGAARNTGLEVARGKYIAYLDDDDIFYPDHLETLVTFLEKSSFKIAYTDANRVIQEKANDSYRTISKEIFPSMDFDKEGLLIEGYFPIICVAHERSCLERTGVFEESEKLYEDWDIWIRMSRIYDFWHIKKVTCEYKLRLDRSNRTAARQDKYLKDLRYIYTKYDYLSKDSPQLKEAQKIAFEEARVRRSDLFIEAYKAQCKGNMELAEKKYREVENKFSKSIYIHYSFGSFLKNKGSFKEAEEEFKCALNLINESSSNFYLEKRFGSGIHFHLGAIYQKLNQRDVAKREFEECLQLNPDHRKAKEFLSWFKKAEK